MFIKAFFTQNKNLPKNDLMAVITDEEFARMQADQIVLIDEVDRHRIKLFEVSEDIVDVARATGLEVTDSSSNGYTFKLIGL